MLAPLPHLPLPQAVCSPPLPKRLTSGLWLPPLALVTAPYRLPRFLPLRRLLPALALAGCVPALLAGDLLFFLARNCCLAERRAQHPCAWWLRPAAAAEAWVVAALYSETGRLFGHLKRGSWRSLGASFDWFCGGLPQVVAEERGRAARRATCCLAAAAAWLPLCA